MNIAKFVLGVFLMILGLYLFVRITVYRTGNGDNTNLKGIGLGLILCLLGSMLIAEAY